MRSSGWGAVRVSPRRLPSLTPEQAHALAPAAGAHAQRAHQLQRLCACGVNVHVIAAAAAPHRQAARRQRQATRLGQVCQQRCSSPVREVGCGTAHASARAQLAAAGGGGKAGDRQEALRVVKRATRDGRQRVCRARGVVQPQLLPLARGHHHHHRGCVQLQQRAACRGRPLTLVKPAAAHFAAARGARRRALAATQTPAAPASQRGGERARRLDKLRQLKPQRPQVQGSHPHFGCTVLDHGSHHRAANWASELVPSPPQQRAGRLARLLPVFLLASPQHLA